MTVNIIPKDCCRSRKLIHNSWVQDVAVSPTFGTCMNRVASVDRNGFVHIHNVQGNQGLEFLSSFNDGLDMNQLTSICWMSDDQIAFGGSKGLIRIRHIENVTFGMTTPSTSGHKGSVLCLARSGSRSQLLVSGGQDGRIKIYDPRSRRALTKEVITISAGYHPVRSLAATCGNNHVTVVAADGGASGDVHVFDSRMPRGYNELDRNDAARWRGNTHGPQGNALGVLPGIGAVTRSIAMSENGELVITGGDDRLVRFWNLGQQVAGGGGGSANSSGGGGPEFNSDSAYLSPTYSPSRVSLNRSGSGNDFSLFNEEEERHPIGLNCDHAWTDSWGISTFQESVESRLLLGSSVLSISCDIGGRTVLCSDAVGGVYVSVSNKVPPNIREIGLSWDHGIGDPIRGTSAGRGTLPLNSSFGSTLGSFGSRDGPAPKLGARKGLFQKKGSGGLDGESSFTDDNGSGEQTWFDSILEENEEDEDEEEDEDDDTRKVSHGYELDMAHHSFREIRSCSRIVNMTGRPMSTAITTNGYLGFTVSDGDDDHSLRLFDLRLGFSPIQLKKDGFGARDMREAGFDVNEIIPAGISARDALRGGFKPKDVANGGFGPEELKHAGCSLSDLCSAGFDDAFTLREVGFTPIELKVAGFAPQELLKAGFSIPELVKAGVRGKVLRDLGCTIGDTLDGVWHSLGKEAYFNELLHVALEWEYLTQKTMGIMRENIREGTFSMIYYADMWEARLNVTNRHVVKDAEEQLTWREGD